MTNRAGIQKLTTSPFFVNITRRILLTALTATALIFSACGTLPPSGYAEVRQALAPTGKLRVGVYAGSPTSMIVDPKSGEKFGIALDLGRELAREIGVPVDVVEFRRIAEVIEALQMGAVDFTFTNASAARAKLVDFTPPMLQLELGYLVPASSAMRGVADVDRAGIRVGVSEGSSSQATLTREYKQARIVAAASLTAAREMLQRGLLDVFATNKAVLHELNGELPEFRILEGRWGVENMAIAMPKGRERGMPTLRAFAERAKQSGLLQLLVEKAGLRGASKDF